MKIVGNTSLRTFIDNLLYDDQSPRAISGRIKHREKNLIYASKNSIYRYVSSVHGRKIESYRKNRKQKKRRHWKKSVRLSGRVFIDKRPKYVQIRKRAGDAEADFVESGRTGKGIILVVEDLKTRTVFLGLSSLSLLGKTIN